MFRLARATAGAGRLPDMNAKIGLWARAGHIKIKVGKGADSSRLDQLIAWAVPK